MLDRRLYLHAFCESWYSAHLVVMEELPPHPPAADRPDVYRLLFLPTFDSPAVVRFSESDGAWRVVCKHSDGLGGFLFPAQLVSKAERDLSTTEAKRFGCLLERVAFRDMPLTEDSLGLDGFQAVLEGVRADRYHVVDRWSPYGTPYSELVEFMLGLCECGGGRTV